MTDRREDFAKVGAIIAAARQPGFAERRGEPAERYPLHPHLGAPAIA